MRLLVITVSRALASVRATRTESISFYLGAVGVHLTTLAGDMPRKFGAAVQVQVRISPAE